MLEHARLAEDIIHETHSSRSKVLAGPRSTTYEVTCTIAGKKDRNFSSTLDYARLQVFNFANVKSHAYWRMNDSIGNVVLKHIYLLDLIYHVSVVF